MIICNNLSNWNGHTSSGHKYIQKFNLKKLQMQIIYEKNIGDIWIIKNCTQKYNILTSSPIVISSHVGNQGGLLKKFVSLISTMKVKSISKFKY